MSICTMAVEIGSHITYNILRCYDTQITNIKSVENSQRDRTTGDLDKYTTAAGLLRHSSAVRCAIGRFRFD